jgi:hypothetical protein
MDQNKLMGEGVLAIMLRLAVISLIVGVILSALGIIAQYHGAAHLRYGLWRC